MFNKLREAIMLAEEKEFEEQSLDLLIEDETFDSDIASFLNEDIKITTLTENDIIDFDPNDPMNEFLMSESKDEECEDKKDCDKEDSDDDEDEKEDEKKSEDDDEESDDDDKKKSEDDDEESDDDKKESEDDEESDDDKKESEDDDEKEEAKKNLKENLLNLIDLKEDENYLYISNEDMNFLIESTYGLLTEEEILDNIEYELNERFKFERGNTHTSGKIDNLTKVKKTTDNYSRYGDKVSIKDHPGNAGLYAKDLVADKIASGVASDTLKKHTSDNVSQKRVDKLKEINDNLEKQKEKNGVNLKDKIKNMPKGAKIAAGVALGGAALGAAGYGVKKLLDKRKAKKEADKNAKNLKECMIDLLIDEDCVYVSNDDMQFLLEACDYELSEEEILDNISESLLSEIEMTPELANALSRRQADRANKVLLNNPSEKDAAAALGRFDRQQERLGRNLTKNGIGFTFGAKKMSPEEVKEKTDRLKNGMKSSNGTNTDITRLKDNKGLKIKKDGAFNNLKNKLQNAPKGAKIAAGVALGGAALGAAGYGVKKLLDKRKAKKEADAKAQSLKECMIDLLIDEDYVYIAESDMDFLLEACNYELSEEEILDNIAESVKNPTVEDLEEDIEDDVELSDLLESMVEDF